ncbi:MAG: hypothetical protein MUO85_01515 [candidate division Zixibacteria bacterium]|nr:hypothetical protein [candidate division Zixibacteria bacterium]
MKLNGFGEIIKKQWQWLGKQYQFVALDKYVIMPNHVHGILIINDCVDVGTGRVEHPAKSVEPVPTKD